ncbi:ShlB/FhaC/HecB family hemolysin secretion/activation protein [Pseudooceanicola onchidii]|uniref:ShlB/FhaC/HecB family hemolysin secretion/activation protein n=1 Tax=Pseudooceanicola onchidii TaxID=2562279 RepID=UPI0010AB128A|nr:ShlB/FhaC/HecB family hemolysin secretion/activation protein [Pseudooceanicola onchidii]
MQLSACLAALIALGAAPALAQGVTLDPGSAVDAQPEGATAAPSDAGQAAAAAEAAAQARDRTPTAQPARQAVARGYVVRDVVLANGSAYLSPDDLARVEAGLIGRRYSLQGLAAIPQAFNQLYAERGISTAQAVLRRVDGGRATVELLEARVGQIGASPGLLSDDYIRFRMAAAPGDLADNRVLEAQVQRMSLTDSLPLQLGFAPGASYGTTDITVLQPDQPRHTTVVTLDNYGSVSSGRPQLSLAHTVRSLTGWNDPLSLTLQLREGSKAGTIGYARTITPGGGLLGFSFSHTVTEDVTGAPLTGQQTTADMTYTQPLIVEPARRLSLTFGLSGYEEIARLAGVQTLGHRGTEVSIGASYYRAGEGWSLTLSPRFLAGRYDDAVTPASNIGYSAVQSTIFASVAIGEDLVASVTASGQKRLSGVMPSQRKFTVTSPSAVRGYPTSLSSGDSGYYLRTQIETLTPFDLGQGIRLRPFAFFDAGQAYDRNDVGLGMAASVGLGVSFVAEQTVFGDIYVAKPLKTGITGWANPSRDLVIGASLSMTF